MRCSGAGGLQAPSRAIGICKHPTFGSSYLIRNAGVELDNSVLRRAVGRTACEEDSVSTIALLDHEEMPAVAPAEAVDARHPADLDGEFFGQGAPRHCPPAAYHGVRELKGPGSGLATRR